jgi:hypothetical protein
MFLSTSRFQQDQTKSDQEKLLSTLEEEFIQQRSENDQKATDTLAKMIHIKPDEFKFIVSMIVMLRENKQYERLIPYCELGLNLTSDEGIKLKPNFLSAKLEAYNALGRIDDAKKLLQDQQK